MDEARAAVLELSMLVFLAGFLFPRFGRRLMPFLWSRRETLERVALGSGCCTRSTESLSGKPFCRSDKTMQLHVHNDMKHDT